MRYVGRCRLRRCEGLWRIRRTRHQRTANPWRRGRRASYAPQGRLLAINSWGQRLKTDYQSLQIAVNKPFTHGLLFKGVFGNPSSSVTSGTFGQITGISGTGSYLERQIQMGLRFSFWKAYSTG